MKNNKLIKKTLNPTTNMELFQVVTLFILLESKKCYYKQQVYFY